MAREPWESELDRLRDDYGRSLPGKLASLETQLREAFRKGGRGDLEAVRREAHSLKGSSGSYGFDEASLELQRIEDALGGLLDRAQEPAADAELPGELSGALARARASLPSA